MEDHALKINFPDGYIIIRSIEYFIIRMPLYDVNRVMSYVSDCDDELEKAEFYMDVFDQMVAYAKAGRVDMRRFWGIIKRFKKLGFAPEWDAEAVISFFNKIEKENEND